MVGQASEMVLDNSGRLHTWFRQPDPAVMGALTMPTRLPSCKPRQAFEKYLLTIVAPAIHLCSADFCLLKREKEGLPPVSLTSLPCSLCALSPSLSEVPETGSEVLACGSPYPPNNSLPTASPWVRRALEAKARALAAVVMSQGGKKQHDGDGRKKRPKRSLVMVDLLSREPGV